MTRSKHRRLLVVDGITLCRCGQAVTIWSRRKCNACNRADITARRQVHRHLAQFR